MAQKIEVRLVDDIDGGEADRTIQFAFEGYAYEIDLSESNAKKMLEALKPYVDAARRQGSQRRSSSARRSSSDTDAKQVRAWAEKHGVDVPARGRIPNSVVESFKAAGNGTQAPKSATAPAKKEEAKQDASPAFSDSGKAKAGKSGS